MLNQEMTKAGAWIWESTAMTLGLDREEAERQAKVAVLALVPHGSELVGVPEFNRVVRFDKPAWEWTWGVRVLVETED